MTQEEIIQAISDDKMMPFIQPEQLAQIVAFVINNYQPSLPSNLDEAADCYKDTIKPEDVDDYANGVFYETFTEYQIADAFKDGAKWMAKQGETVAGIVTKVGDKLDVETTEYLIPEESEFERCDKVIIQIRKE